ncbi:hypothetical protein KCP74_15115 [Salmonella enterica subsp. enterica]|nr:hypothetical protein KCP74_15115 [Salmonella enterica subsp. enterica]
MLHDGRHQAIGFFPVQLAALLPVNIALIHVSACQYALPANIDDLLVKTEAASAPSTSASRNAPPVFHARAGGDQRHAANVTTFFNCTDRKPLRTPSRFIISSGRFPRAALLYLLGNSSPASPPRHAGYGFHRRYTVNMIYFPRRRQTVSIPTTMHRTPKRSARRVISVGSAQPGVDRDLNRPERKNLAASPLTGYRPPQKRNVDRFGNARHPAFIDYATIKLEAVNTS